MSETKRQIEAALQKLTSHTYIQLTTRGNNSIKTALSIVPKGSDILIPHEGGWLTYKTIPKELKLNIVEVATSQAKIDLKDLKAKLQTNKFRALLYQEPAGYFANQPVKEIYELCHRYNCMVIIDITGCIGTPLCQGEYADCMVASFGEWKLIDAKVGGFLSLKDPSVAQKITYSKPLENEDAFPIILQKIKELPERISTLQKIRTKIIEDLKKAKLQIIHPEDVAFVVVVKFNSDQEKEHITSFCTNNHLEYTICPRYIRLLEPAISIEVKRVLYSQILQP